MDFKNYHILIILKRIVKNNIYSVRYVLKLCEKGVMLFGNGRTADIFVSSRPVCENTNHNNLPIEFNDLWTLEKYIHTFYFAFLPLVIKIFYFTFDKTTEILNSRHI